MKQRIQKLLAWYLALSFVFAGLIAISPSLHQTIEHAGQGPAHTHFASVAQRGVAEAEQGGSAGKLQEQAKASSIEIDPKHAIFRHRHGCDLPDFGKLFGLISKALQEQEGSSSTEGSSGEVPNHEHNSLPQLLARGLLEQPLDLPVFELFRAPIVSECEFAEPILYFQHWNAQTATRGPPAVLS